MKCSPRRPRTEPSRGGAGTCDVGPVLNGVQNGVVGPRDLWGSAERHTASLTAVVGARKVVRIDQLNRVKPRVGCGWVTISPSPCVLWRNRKQIRAPGGRKILGSYDSAVNTKEREIKGLKENSGKKKKQRWGVQLFLQNFWWFGLLVMRQC